MAEAHVRTAQTRSTWTTVRPRAARFLRARSRERRPCVTRCVTWTLCVTPGDGGVSP